MIFQVNICINSVTETKLASCLSILPHNLDAQIFAECLNELYER